MKLSISSSPHVKGDLTTRRMMLDVVLALLPALLVGVWQFGLRALAVTLISVASCLIAEMIWGFATRRRLLVSDGSALVTGMLLAMTLPTSVPYYVAAMGGVFAVVIVKAMCGGLGQNVFNPALAARALLMLLFPAALTRFAEVGAPMGLGMTVDIVASATPLHHMQMPALPEISLLDCLLGRMPGCIGEVSALALMLGGVYLTVRRVSSLRIPLAYLGTVALLTLMFHKTEEPVGWMLYSLLGGGVMLGAIFMATDYATSPVTHWGQVIYGVGCGALTVLLRYFGLYPEGVTYAILLMNAVVWALDRVTSPRTFGHKKGGWA